MSDPYKRIREHLADPQRRPEVACAVCGTPGRGGLPCIPCWEKAGRGDEARRWHENEAQTAREGR